MDDIKIKKLLTYPDLELLTKEDLYELRNECLNIVTKINNILDKRNKNV
ncbi:MAG: hypothetical protein M0P71_17210 [Melioribacteraceae bacterium]|jgi:hypothetical protein|nr:hypothetical protein [Melioribacteraceae bacterium]